MPFPWIAQVRASCTICCLPAPYDFAQGRLIDRGRALPKTRGVRLFRSPLLEVLDGEHGRDARAYIARAYIARAYIAPGPSG